MDRVTSLVSQLSRLAGAAKRKVKPNRRAVVATHCSLPSGPPRSAHPPGARAALPPSAGSFFARITGPEMPLFGGYFPRSARTAHANAMRRSSSEGSPERVHVHICQVPRTVVTRLLAVQIAVRVVAPREPPPVLRRPFSGEASRSTLVFRELRLANPERQFQPPASPRLPSRKSKCRKPGYMRTAPRYVVPLGRGLSMP
jgi:hypothetical protein